MDEETLMLSCRECGERFETERLSGTGSYPQRCLPCRKERKRQQVIAYKRGATTEKVKRVREWHPADPMFRERDYTPEETEFMLAVDRYKREAGRPHPSWAEVLAVAISLGYRKVSPT